LDGGYGFGTGDRKAPVTEAIASFLIAPAAAFALLLALRVLRRFL